MCSLPSPYQARDRGGRVHSGGHRAPGTWAGYHLPCGWYRVRCLFLYGGDADLGGGAMGTRGRWGFGEQGSTGRA